MPTKSDIQSTFTVIGTAIALIFGPGFLLELAHRLLMEFWHDICGQYPFWY